MSVLSVSGLVEQQVRARPDAAAVISRRKDGGEHRLTYRELSRSANRLAAHLAARGIARGDRVATSLRPGPDLVTAFLAITRAGAAYVPLDPTAPPERRRTVVRSGRIRAVLTAGGAETADHGVPVIGLRTDAPAIAAHDGSLPSGSPSPDDTAYVCYVARADGAPHGIPVTHRALLDFLTADDHLRPAPAKGVAQPFGTVAFEVWLPLVAGQPLVTGSAVSFGSDFPGWESSYDSQPLPLDHLREWRSAALTRIRELDSRRRVLEIGAGSGLLLAHLARDTEVEEYWATDTSSPAVDALRAHTAADPALRDKVRVCHRAAPDDLGGLPARHFDTVIVGSPVNRPFPSLTHLRTLVERVLPLLAPGGALLLGDVRNLELDHCFRTGVALAQPGAAAQDRAALRHAIDRRADEETELLAAPGLFAALARELPAVRAVDVRVRRGIHHNELTRYRYDAVLHTAAPVADLTDAPALRWGHEIPGLEEFERYVEDRRPATLRLTGIPNRRVHDEHTALHALYDPAHSIDLPPQDAPAPDPEVLCAAAERLGYRALPTWSPDSPELLDLVLLDPDRIPAGPLDGTCALTHHTDPEKYVNIPTTPASGQDHPRPQPGTPLQEIVRDLFAEALALPRYAVHADSDFFRLGGHSRSAARFLTRARETLGTDPGGDALHRAPTPAAFAALVGDRPVAFTGPCGAGPDSALLPLELLGRLDVRALERALEDLGARHEALRNSRLGAAGTRLRSLGPEKHRLDLALPAGSVDLWSHLPLAADLARAYAARATGTAPHRSPAGLDAAPRAVFGDVPPTPLPGSTPQSYDPCHGSLAVEVDATLHTRLTRFAAERGATLFMVTHAALATVLTRLGPQTESTQTESTQAESTSHDDHRTRPITVAAPVPSRDCAELRNAVGPFARVLALTVDVSGDPAFAELLRRVRTADLAAYRDGDAPLALPGGVALTVLQETPGAAQFEAAGLSICPGTPELPLPKADLVLTLTERQTASGESAGLTLTASYRHETVGEAVAASVTGQLTAALRAALDAPATPLSQLCLLPGAQNENENERKNESDPGVWAGPGTGLPPAETLTALFADRVALMPHAPALSGMDYAELDSRSDLLAHALLEHRTGPGTSVLTALSSPTAFAVAALAVAKTGAALLPVDPCHELPEELRPAVLLLDETADLLLPAVPGAARLVRDTAADQLPADGYWPVTDADRLRPTEPGDPLLLAPGDDGTVVIGPEAVLTAALSEPADAAWLVQRYPDADTALGLLGTLLSGARVHVPDSSLAHAVPHEVLAWLGRTGARVLLGGPDDALSALVALARCEDAALTVSGGWAEGRLVVEQRPGRPPRPAPGYRAYVLDARLRPVAPGAVGALYIAGTGVAQGYAGAPAATGERFLPDPFGGPDGHTARMWRTGRAARLDEDCGLRVLDRPADDDPFADEYATFVVLTDAQGHHALWPAAAAVPEGWYESHAEDLYELCVAHINDAQPGDLF